MCLFIQNDKVLMTESRQRVCGCSLKWSFSYSVCLDTFMIKSWQKVKHGLLHSGLRVIQPGVYVCTSASPCDPWPAVTLRPWWKDWVGRQEPSRPGMISLVTLSSGGGTQSQ